MTSKHHPLAFLLPALVVLFVLAEITTYYACVVDGSTARRVLAEEGYTDIFLGTYSWDGCPKGDAYRRTFRARHHGVFVDGVVCCSGTWSLNCDVRH